MRGPAPPTRLLAKPVAVLPDFGEPEDEALEAARDDEANDHIMKDEDEDEEPHNELPGLESDELGADEAPAPGSPPTNRPLLSTEVEKGMLVTFDGNLRGCVENVFSDLDEYWLCSEESGNTIFTEGEGAGHGHVRTFMAGELTFSGEWSSKVEIEETVPVQAAVISRLLKMDEWEAKMEELTEVGVMIAEVDGLPGNIRIGPGIPPKVRAASKAVRKSLTDLGNEMLREANQAQEAAVAAAAALLPQRHQAHIPSNDVPAPTPEGIERQDETWGAWGAGSAKTQEASQWARSSWSSSRPSWVKEEEEQAGDATAAKVAQWGQAVPKPPVPVVPSSRATEPQPHLQQAAAHVEAPPAAAAVAPAAVPAEASPPPKKMTVAEWIDAQGQFADLPRLPKHWIRIKKSSGEGLYFFDVSTGDTSIEEPLPRGWSQHIARSTGQTYYFHSEHDLKQFERPDPDF